MSRNFLLHSEISANNGLYCWELLLHERENSEQQMRTGEKSRYRKGIVGNLREKWGSRRRSSAGGLGLAAVIQLMKAKDGGLEVSEGRWLWRWKKKTVG
jgi:hypothetical protein